MQITDMLQHVLHVHVYRYTDPFSEDLKTFYTINRISSILGGGPGEGGEEHNTPVT